jgi:hypothetical protein
MLVFLSRCQYHEVVAPRPAQYVIDTPTPDRHRLYPRSRSRMPSPPPEPKGERQLDERSVLCFVLFRACRFTYPKLRFVPILRERRHAQQLVIRILRYRVLVFRFDDTESGSSSRSGAGPQLLKCLFMGVLFGVELGQRGQGVTREASGDQLQ